jgi:uncharacterized protein (DUF885 family)
VEWRHGVANVTLRDARHSEIPAVADQDAALRENTNPDCRRHRHRSRAGPDAAKAKIAETRADIDQRIADATARIDKAKADLAARLKELSAGLIG